MFATRYATLGVIVALFACTETPQRTRDAGANDARAADGGRDDRARVDGARDDLARDSAQPADATPFDAPRTDQPNPASVVLRVTFDDSPVGPYEEATMRAEWPGTKWASLARASIVEGAEAKSGRSLRIFYPRETFGPGDGGAQWWVDLPRSYDELYCAYWVKFGDGFDFVKGGKIPGLMGGAGNTGGSKPDGTDGWSARMMWRTDGDAVQYLYHPDQPSTWGEELAYDVGGQRRFTPGEWVRVEHRVVMNTPGQHDGIVQSWWNGELALDRRDIRYRDVDTFAIDIFYFSTFFGGGDATWASTKDEYAYFDDFIIATEPITH